MVNGKKNQGNDFIFWDEMWNNSENEKVFDEDHALDIVLNTMIDEIDWKEGMDPNDKKEE